MQGGHGRHPDWDKGLFGCMPNLSHNPAPHFAKAKVILPHFYESLTGGTKVVG
jgi:hypothetical protein